MADNHCDLRSHQFNNAYQYFLFLKLKIKQIKILKNSVITFSGVVSKPSNITASRLVNVQKFLRLVQLVFVIYQCPDTFSRTSFRVSFIISFLRLSGMFRVFFLNRRKINLIENGALALVFKNYFHFEAITGRGQNLNLAIIERSPVLNIYQPDSLSFCRSIKAFAIIIYDQYHIVLLF